MTQFEKITQSPETLGAFLAALPVIEGPWDKEFQARFCVGCAATCDVCPHAAERNNPHWWLTMTGEPSEETKRAAEKIAAIVDQYSALEAAKLLEISMKSLEVLKDEQVPANAWVTAISIAQAIGIHERG